MANYQNLLYEKQRQGVLITLNRPRVLNAINEELMSELDRALAQAESDAEIRAVVITGSDGAFSAGEDLSGDDPETAWPYGIPEGSSLNATYNKFRDADRRDILGRQLYRWQYPKPLIAAVSGWCLGGASWLALTCHLTIAADDTVFGQPQVRHGANTDFIWVALAGFKNALRYSLTGDHVDAQEALRIGLVNQVVPKDQLLETAFQFVERVARIPPETVKINLHISTLGMEMMGLRKAWTLNAELAAMARLTKREEFNKPLEEAKKQGGVKAFVQKRDTPFQPEPFGPRAKK
ncbi:MAG TPA: enoyl-CoA hydratase/isomerase family protein [Gammaproteobacteria bacterium]|nr:enoyl-CoA hydratase/isomerase family protein [Candidatus Binatia bacterium]HEX2242160.1 enoyl-CoA hydratase/isomerase family protein [Gammaproteobacteria bacterium]